MSDKKEKANDLHIVLQKLDTIGEDIFGRVQDMLNTFENKILSRMEEHLDKYEKRMTETTKEFTEEVQKHSNLLKKHEIDIHSIDGKTEAVRKRMTDIEAKVDGVTTGTKLEAPKKIHVVSLAAIAAILGVNVVALVYSVSKMMELLGK